ncbi:MAG TPA: NAD(P)-dependent oxidoreductase [Bacteroidia bacterium]|nr:NAD(P)-dependent oxidoreductase [Bacteroidia bacterium]
MNILITGCNGLVGETLSKELNKNSSLNLYGLGRTDKGHINTIVLDLNTNWSENQLPQKIDIIIHLAQSEKFREFPESSLEVFNVNTISTLKLLDYARKAGASKFIYASSGGIYGNSNVGFNEDDLVVNKKDLGFYLGSKFCSEIIAENYNTFFDIIILRFFFVYGKEQKSSMLIPRLLNNILQEKEIVIQGNDGIKINPVHVDDASKAIIKCLDIKGSHKINIAGPDVLSLREICEIIGTKIDKKPIFKAQDTEPKHLFGDIAKMQKLLIKPEIKFAEGINELIEKYA